MKRLLALALCTSMLASPALAQYYGGPPPGYGGGGGYGRGGDDDDYEPRRSRPRWEERRGDYGRGDYGRGGGEYGPRGGRYGSVCITSRGSCPTRPAPRNAPCRCDLPGGEKRGNVQ